MVAPFWSDNDIRRSGSVHYVNITLGDSNHGDELINTVSKFIQHQNDEAAEQNFTGDWMLIAHWDRVHPYPHGLASSVISNYYNGFTLKVRKQWMNFVAKISFPISTGELIPGNSDH